MGVNDRPLKEMIAGSSLGWLSCFLVILSLLPDSTSWRISLAVAALASCIIHLISVASHRP